MHLALLGREGFAAAQLLHHVVHPRHGDALVACQRVLAVPVQPLGHVRDSRKQTRYVERDLAAILQAAGGTLPAYGYPVPEWRRI